MKDHPTRTPKYLVNEFINIFFCFSDSVTKKKRLLTLVDLGYNLSLPAMGGYINFYKRSNRSIEGIRNYALEIVNEIKNGSKEDLTRTSIDDSCRDRIKKFVRLYNDPNNILENKVLPNFETLSDIFGVDQRCLEFLSAWEDGPYFKSNLDSDQDRMIVNFLEHHLDTDVIPKDVLGDFLVDFYPEESQEIWNTVKDAYFKKFLDPYRSEISSYMELLVEKIKEGKQKSEESYSSKFTLLENLIRAQVEYNQPDLQLVMNFYNKKLDDFVEGILNRLTQRYSKVKRN